MLLRKVKKKQPKITKRDETLNKSKKPEIKSKSWNYGTRHFYIACRLYVLNVYSMSEDKKKQKKNSYNTTFQDDGKLMGKKVMGASHNTTTVTTSSLKPLPWHNIYRIKMMKRLMGWWWEIDWFFVAFDFIE